MKTVTVITQYAASWGRDDGYIVATYRGRRLFAPIYFANNVEYQVKHEKLLSDLREQGATHFRHVLN